MCRECLDFCCCCSAELRKYLAGLDDIKSKRGPLECNQIGIKALVKVEIILRVHVSIYFHIIFGNRSSERLGKEVESSPWDFEPCEQSQNFRLQGYSNIFVRRFMLGRHPSIV